MTPVSADRGQRRIVGVAVCVAAVEGRWVGLVQRGGRAQSLDEVGIGERPLCHRGHVRTPGLHVVAEGIERSTIPDEQQRVRPQSPDVGEQSMVGERVDVEERQVQLGESGDEVTVEVVTVGPLVEPTQRGARRKPDADAVCTDCRRHGLSHLEGES